MNDMNPADEGGTLFVENPDNYEQIPTTLLMDPNVGDGEVRLWLMIRSYGGQNNTRGRFPSRRRLAQMIGKGVKTVDIRLGRLVALGWLLITPRWRADGTGQTSNAYYLPWNQIRTDDDPRLVAHRAQLAEFEEGMQARRAANLARKPVDNPGDRRDRSVRIIPGQEGAQDLTPPRPGVNSYAPPAQEVTPPGAQFLTPQEPHLALEPHLDEPPPPATPAPSPVENQEEEATNPAQILDRLPKPWILDGATRKRCEPLIRELLATWPVDELLKTLTHGVSGIGDPRAVFYTRVRGTDPKDLTAKPAPVARPADVPRCDYHQQAQPCNACIADAKAGDLVAAALAEAVPERVRREALVR